VVIPSTSMSARLVSRRNGGSIFAFLHERVSKRLQLGTLEGERDELNSLKAW